VSASGWVVVKTGKTFSALIERRGDFEDWILVGLGVGKEQANVVNVCQGEALPDYGQVSGVVITGSHAMVTERHEWSERAADWLAGAVARQIPTLGICYGHQLLAHALGGQAGNNPNGYEFGTTTVCLNDVARHDRLLGGLPAAIKAHVSHRQSALVLPPGAMLLASSDREAHQAFVVNGCAWGVQFHPEFDAEVTRAYIERSRDALAGQGQSPQDLLASVEATPEAASILRRFARLVGERI